MSFSIAFIVKEIRETKSASITAQELTCSVRKVNGLLHK